MITYNTGVILVGQCVAILDSSAPDKEHIVRREVMCVIHVRVCDNNIQNSTIHRNICI